MAADKNIYKRVGKRNDMKNEQTMGTDRAIIRKNKFFLLLEPRGGVLDQLLDGDVPSRFQKHTRSLYQFFQNVYPTL